MKNFLRVILLFCFMAGSAAVSFDLKPYVPRHLLVKVTSGYADLVRETAEVIGARHIQSFSLVPGLRLYELLEDTEITTALDEFRNTDGVEYVEPDYVVNALVPNDPRFSELWALENTGQTGGALDADINANTMWQLENGNPNVVVAVIDSGIEPTHPDLAANMWRNTLEIAGNNIDDDNNGYVDDIYGINAITNDGNPRDDHAHGTHCAGTIGADGNNNRGVVGVAQDVKIIACKFLNAKGSGSISDAIQCLQYLAALKTRAVSPVNLVATNNSWGGGGFSNALRDAIRAHQTIDVLFVAAAGNESQNNDTTASYPANYNIANVISVAATDNTDKLASFSNYGVRSVHVAAPGVKILSTVLNGGYSFFSGTSMATPHVTGLIAIIKSRYPSYDYKKIKNLVISSGTPIASLKNKTISSRRIRGASSNGVGALTCTNQQAISRLQPRAATTTIQLGSSIFLSALNTNCALSAGALQVYADANETIILDDLGTKGDVVAGDGVASLSWTPRRAGRYVLNFGNGDNIIIEVFSTIPVLRYQATIVPYEYETIVGTSLRADDETIHSVSTPFPILYNGGEGYNRAYVTANGTISFTTTTNPGFYNQQLPLYATQTMLAPYWDDLIAVLMGNSNVFIDTLGTSPHRRFVIEWRNVQAHGAAGTGTFQTVFYENSSDVRFNYLDTDFDNPSNNFGASATSGIQTSPTEAVRFSFNTPSLPSLTSVLYQLKE